MTALHITDIESAINYWRERHPSPDGVLLSPEVRALAEVYALMIFWHEAEVQVEGFPSHAMAAWLAWPPPGWPPARWRSGPWPDRTSAQRRRRGPGPLHELAYIAGRRRGAGHEHGNF
jgi:hypothetical protein